MTSSTSALALHAMLLSSLAAHLACGGTVVFEEDGSGGGGSAPSTSSSVSPTTSTSASTTSGPLTCALEEGEVQLVPHPDNAPGCRGVVGCEVWFGHGQHLSCPGPFSKGLPFASCDVWDCLCATVEDGFVANFATGEVVDARDPAMTCRYVLVWPS